MKHFKPLLKNKNFLFLWVSQFLSQVAIHTLNFLVILKIYGATHSTIATSLVWLVFIIPAIILGPLASAFVDMVDKRNILMLTNVSQALIIVAYAFFHERILFISYGVVLMYSVFNQFYIPAEVASLPSLIAEKYLPQANGLFIATYQIGLVMGFGLSGLVGELVGFRTAFLLAGGLLLLAFLSVERLPKLGPGKKAVDIRKNFNEFVDEVIEGFEFIRSKREIYIPFLTISGLQVSLATLFVILPKISESILALNPSYSGIAIVAPCGIGAIAGISVVARLLSEKARKRDVAKYALAIITASMWVVAFGLKPIPLPYRYGAAFAVSLVIGASFVGIFIPAQTHLQIVTPKEMMARVFGNSWFFTTVLTVFPIMFSATITDILGARMLFSIVAIGLTGVLVFYNKYV
jgi:MFS family permease